MYIGDLRHYCTIISKTVVGQSGTGREIKSSSSVNSKCLFVQPDGSVFDTESGRHVKKNPQVMLPASAILSEDKTISTSQPGWAGTYKIVSIMPLEDRYSITGYICDIEVIYG